MIIFPQAKINLGLHVLKKREDSYHEVDTCMYSIPLFDILEILMNCEHPATEVGAGTYLCHIISMNIPIVISSISCLALHLAAVRGRIEAARFLVEQFVLTQTCIPLSLPK
jgi:4-diphosphocytidyl-2C-methyl-D-erythritol kinase